MPHVLTGELPRALPVQRGEDRSRRRGRLPVRRSVPRGTTWPARWPGSSASRSTRRSARRSATAARRSASTGSCRSASTGNTPSMRRDRSNTPQAVLRRDRRDLQASGRAVPVFNDKHLSYRWDLAKAMYDESRRLAFPFMAGSSVPLAQRRPSWSCPPGLRSARRCRSTAGISRVMTSTASRCSSRWSNPARGARRRRRGAIPHRRALWKAADDGLWSVRAGRRRHGRRARPRPADPARAADAGGETPARSDPRDPRVLRRRPAGGRPESRPVARTRWNFACRIEGAGRPRRRHGSTARRGHELLHRPLGQSQPLQGPLPRDPVDVPDRPTSPIRSSARC